MLNRIVRVKYVYLNPCDYLQNNQLWLQIYELYKYIYKQKLTFTNLYGLKTNKTQQANIIFMCAYIQLYLCVPI